MNYNNNNMSVDLAGELSGVLKEYGVDEKVMQQGLSSLEKVKNRLLENFDELVKSSVDKTIPLYEEALGENTEDKRVLRNFFEKEQFNELRKLSLKAFFNAISDNLIENSYVFLKQGEPLSFIKTPIDLTDEIKQEMKEKNILILSVKNIEESQDKIFDLFAENILFFPFQYKMIDTVRELGGCEKPYEYKEIFENTDFSKVENSIFIKKISEIYKDEDDTLCKALNILEYYDRRREKFNEDSEIIKKYIKFYANSEFFKLPKNEIKTALNHLYSSNTEYYKEYFKEENDEGLNAAFKFSYDYLDTQYLPSSILNLLKKDKVLKKVDIEILSNFLVFHNNFITNVLFSERESKSVQNENMELVDKISDIFLLDYITTGKKKYAGLLSKEMDRNTLYHKINNKIERYRVENNERQITDNVVCVMDEKSLMIRLPVDFYAYLPTQKGVDYRSLLVTSGDDDYIKLYKNQELYLGCILDNDIVLTKEEILVIFAKHVTNAISGDKVNKDVCLEQLIRTININNKMAIDTLIKQELNLNLDEKNKTSKRGKI